MTLSTEDRQLLREVFRAARAKGWSRAADCGAHEWSGQEERSPNVTLVRDEESDRFELWVYEWEPTYRCVQLPHPTVRQAVDLLVLLGILPSEFSSAYREGVDVVTDLSVEQAIDAEIDRVWEGLQTNDFRHVIATRIEEVAKLVVNGDPWASREAADRVVQAVCEWFDRKAVTT